MFENAAFYAVLPASDLARARSFWHDTFGIDPVDDGFEEGDAEMFDVGGTRVLVYETQFAGTAKNTALNLVTDNLDRDMTALRTHGVTFHDYDMPGFTTVDGVADFDGDRGAWFSDSEDNIIAISQPSPERLQMAMRMRAAAGSG